jgi:hypothetical protein
LHIQIISCSQINKFIPAVFGAIKSVIVDTNGNLIVGAHEFLNLYNNNKQKSDTIGKGRRFTALSHHDGKLYYGNNKGLFEKTNYKNLMRKLRLKINQKY